MTTQTDAVIGRETSFAERLEQLKRQYPQPEPERGSPNWLESTFGMFKEDPTWDVFMRHMEQERNRDREATTREYEKSSGEH